MQVINQKPSVLLPDYSDDITKDLDAPALIEMVKAVLAPIRTPLTSGSQAAIIQDAMGLDIDDDEIVARLLDCCGEAVDTGAEDFCRELFRKTLLSYDARLPAEAVFIAQANAVAKCPPPAGNVLYVTDDLKDACRRYISSPLKYREFLECTEAFVVPERHVAVHFLTKLVFDDYKAFVASFAQAHATSISPDDLQKFQDFAAIDLDVMEGLMLRASDADGLGAYSFERVLMRATMEWLRTGPDAGIVVPYVSELFCPKNLVFLDVEQVARCPRNRLDRLLGDIHSAMRQKLAVASLGKIARMTAVASQKRKIQSQLANAMQAASGGPAGRRMLFRFGRTAPPPARICRRIAAIVKRQANVASSENYSKTVKQSYQRSNRRDPDNFNLKGKSIGMTFKPDIHVYLDTSGSISEDNYKAAVMTCILLAKKLDVNLYFNSFSHVISECAHLRTRGLSPAGIYRAFQRVPKVTGGTNFRNVWEYINATPKRRAEVSIMVTDLEYAPPTERVVHPGKLWYVPIAVDDAAWPTMVRNAEAFCKAMFHIDGNIRSRILM